MGKESYQSQRTSFQEARSHLQVMFDRSEFGVYVHWPFCQAKCPYCDFNSHVTKSIDYDVWVQAYLSEITRLADETPGRILRSIFFGGGTPSLMPGHVVSEVINACRAHWPVSNDLEITLEANPTSVEAERFQLYAEAGVNRISIGFQALNDRDLRALGRLHNVEESLEAFEIAKLHFDRVSFDLIYARQNQSLEDWQAELAHALSLRPDHLSLYQLTIEAGTAFADRLNSGKLAGLPGEDLSADMYDLTQEMTSAAGLDAYEISNHAKPGQASRHNLIYWRSGEWVGIGPGAHGRLNLNDGRVSTECHKNPAIWIESVKAKTSGESLRATLTQRDILEERMLMGLRLSEGISVSCNDLSMMENVTELSSLGLLLLEDGVLKVTARGRQVLNYILRELLS